MPTTRPNIEPGANQLQSFLGQGRGGVKRGQGVFQMISLFLKTGFLLPITSGGLHTYESAIWQREKKRIEMWWPPGVEVSRQTQLPVERFALSLHSTYQLWPIAEHARPRRHCSDSCSHHQHLRLSVQTRTINQQRKHIVVNTRYTFNPVQPARRIPKSRPRVTPQK